MTERFPYRTVFKEWIADCFKDGEWYQYGFWKLCRRVLYERDRRKIEYLYEFCAARGHLMTYNQVWEELNGKDQHATAEELEID